MRQGTLKKLQTKAEADPQAAEAGCPVTAPNIAPHLDAARVHGRNHDGGPFRRIVVRMPPDDIVRLDAVRATFPKKTSRAALVRAFTLAMLATFPEAPLPERCEP